MIGTSSATSQDWLETKEWDFLSDEALFNFETDTLNFQPSKENDNEN